MILNYGLVNKGHCGSLTFQLRQPTKEQVKYARSLGISTLGKSFRVISAEIADTLEVKSFAHIEKIGLAPGLKVKYIGSRTDLSKNLVISSIGRNGYIYFKGTLKHCRPRDIEKE